MSVKLFCTHLIVPGIKTSGIYEIQPVDSSRPFMVLCDMETRGGGWTHIHKRFDGSQEFYLGWREYKFGFGDLEGEFWLGLQHMHLLTGEQSFCAYFNVYLTDIHILKLYVG